MYKSVITAAFIAAISVSGAIASELRTTTSSDAMCSDGTQATYSFDDFGSNKWAVVLMGGGLARNPDEYRDRVKNQPRFVTAQKSAYTGGQGIQDHLIENGYNMIFVPYCSNDLWAGNHSHKIDGKTVQFRGRAIIESIFEEMADEFKNADELLVAGYSAGAIGIGFNADLIGQYGNARVVPDGFWFDKATKSFYNGWAKKNDRSWLYKTMPKHCKGDWVGCYPSRENFERNGIKDVFLIWNVGDRYARPVNKDAFKKAVKNDINHYGAGYSIDAEKRQVHGFEDWGHVLAFDKNTYNKTYTEQSLKSAMDNWLNKTGDQTVVDY